MMMTSTFRRHAANGFTLIELLIVVIIIAILAAIAIPQFSNTSSDAQESALDANLSTVRSAIELYRVQHSNKYPSKAAATGGVTNDCTTAKGTIGKGLVDSKEAFVEQLTGYSNAAGATCTQAGAGFIYGPYLRTMPAEPISNKADVDVVTAVDAAEPTANTGGWRFNNATGKFQANSNAPGRDTTRLLSAH